MLVVSKRAPDWRSAQDPLEQWYSTSLGESILDEMETLLERLLPEIFGYQGLQIGQISQKIKLLESAGLHKKLIMGADTDFSGVDMGGDALQLPIASDTMNLVLLPHTLDFCGNPHQVLREADRVLTNDGHLVIIGFNPLSMWGVRHYLMRWRGAVPWSGEFYSRRRVSDWLSLLSFRKLQEETFFMRWPISNTTVLRRTKFLEKMRPMLGALGGVYIIHARKQTIPMTLSRYKWRRHAASIAVGSLARRANRRSTQDRSSE